MAQPYIGEIRMFGGNFAPVGWQFADGRLLPIDEYDTLFNLIGTTYGGDGQQTFGLPDLQGRVPVHTGKGPGLTQNYVVGEKGGAEEVTLTGQQLPEHGHAFMASTGPGSSPNPAGNVIGPPSPCSNAKSRKEPWRRRWCSRWAARNHTKTACRT